MVKIGNFFFHYRNTIFPIFYLALFIPSPKIFSNFLTPIILGLIVLLIGQGIRVATIGLVYIIRGGRNRQIYAEDLVTDGIFSHCRNPLYLGNVVEILGLGILANSIIFVLIMFPLFVFIYQAIIRAEEDFLSEKFGAKFDDYLKKVNRWIPNFKGINQTLKSMKFNWKRVVIKEYNSTFIWSFAAVLLIMKNYYVIASVQNFNESLPYFILIIILLMITYGVIRYLKKSHKLVSQ
ncbi:MAG: lipid A Kdo2 1-phosphate O-methyltransferase [Ignavibacterium sp.]